MDPTKGAERPWPTIGAMGIVKWGGHGLGWHPHMEVDSRWQFRSRS